jgi:dTDP-glucose pyrophosphorylase
MKFEITQIIRSYIDDEKNVPLIDVKGTYWYHITEEEKNALVRLAADLDQIPNEEFQRLTDAEKWTLSCAWNDANRIVRNSVIRG